LLVMAACSGNGGTAGMDASADPMDTAAGATDAAPEVATELTCLMIRNCIYLCREDPACTQGCIDRGASAARALYAEVAACSAQACPDGDIDCRCINECFVDGACLDLLDTCTQALEEGFCTMCH
jgi:hypothetical protein